VQVRLDGSQDASVLAAEDLGPLQSDAGQMNLAASDALAVVRRGAQTVESLGLLRPVGGAEKLAGQELASPEPDAQTSAVSVVLAAAPLLSAVLLRAVPELDKPDGAPSAAQSFAGLASAGARQRASELALEAAGLGPVRR
jgi:hypothetical protein